MSDSDVRPPRRGGPDDPYEATIEGYARWGPFAWYISITKGLVEFSGDQFAWTEKRAAAKARRTIRRMEAADNRRRSTRRTIVGYQSAFADPGGRASTGATT